MQIEIEVKSPDARNDIYELRKYLLDNVTGLELRIKEQPAREGQMSGGVVETLVAGLLHVAIAIPLEELYQELLKPKIEKWLESRKHKAAGKMEVMSTLKDQNSKIHFLEDSEGKSQVFDNLRYAIDTDNTYALLIGCSEFDSSFTAIPPVEGNIVDLVQLLTDKRHIGLPAENVTVAFNKQNTEVEELLLKTSRKTGIETLIIYYAGHGHRSDVKKLYLTTKNTKKIDDYILGGIDFDFVNNAVLRSSTARQKIVILDACHSGIATQGNQDLMMGIDVKGSYILASSPGDEVSYFQKEQRNTYFTGVLLDLLKNGLDNSSDMLALEDIYDYTSNRLIQKNFPKPIFKSELNIPPANFFIARNPSFSLEKLKQRPLLLLRQGRMDEALYEYRLLLQRFPDDLALRKEASDCETEVLFTRMVQEGDELFFRHHDYQAAGEKYKKARQVKEDYLLLDKIRKCEEHLRRSGRQEENISHVPDKVREEIRLEKEKPAQPKEDIVLRKQSDPVKKQEEKQIQPRPVGGRRAMGMRIAAGWLLLSLVVHFWIGQDKDSALEVFTDVSLPCLVVGFLLLVFRYPKASWDEVMIYAVGATAGLIILSAHVAADRSLSRWGFLLMLLVFIGYFLLFLKKYRRLSLTGFVIALMPHVLFPPLFIPYLIIMFFFRSLSSFEDNPARFAGPVLAILTIAGFVIYFSKEWRKARKQTRNAAANTA